AIGEGGHARIAKDTPYGQQYGRRSLGGALAEGREGRKERQEEHRERDRGRRGEVLGEAGRRGRERIGRGHVRVASELARRDGAVDAEREVLRRTVAEGDEPVEGRLVEGVEDPGVASDAAGVGDLPERHVEALRPFLL